MYISMLFTLVVTVFVVSTESVVNERDGAVQVCAIVSHVAVATLVPFTITFVTSPGN